MFLSQSFVRRSSIYDIEELYGHSEEVCLGGAAENGDGDRATRDVRSAFRWLPVEARPQRWNSSSSWRFKLPAFLTCLPTRSHDMTRWRDLSRKLSTLDREYTVDSYINSILSVAMAKKKYLSMIVTHDWGILTAYVRLSDSTRRVVNVQRSVCICQARAAFADVVLQYFSPKVPILRQIHREIAMALTGRPNPCPLFVQRIAKKKWYWLLQVQLSSFVKFFQVTSWSVSVFILQTDLWTI